MVRQHHQLNGHECEQTLRDSGEAWHATVHGIAKNLMQLATEQQQEDLCILMNLNVNKKLKQ